MNEFTLQRQWARQAFNKHYLSTENGLSVGIVHPGKLNKGDGPDFLDACVFIGGKRMYGDIEIHIKRNDWFNHQHHTDPRYNQVILHVFSQQTKGRQTLRSDGTTITELHVNPGFVSYDQNILPCHHAMDRIPHPVIRHQLDLGSTAYFEQKTNSFTRLMGSIDSRSFEKRWEGALILSIADILGIPANRTAMADLAAAWLATSNSGIQTNPVSEHLLRIAALTSRQRNSEGFSRQSWDFTGGRPANHPALRIRQLAAWTNAIKQADPSPTSADCIQKWWQALESSAQSDEKIGAHRRQLVFKLAVLPAMWVALSKVGTPYHILDIWHNTKHPMPASIRSEFRHKAWNPHSEKGKLIGQHKTFCSPRNCHKCHIGKYLIQ